MAVSAVLALSACGGTEIGTQNNCSTGADCAGRDHAEGGQGKTKEPPESSPSPSSAASAESAAPPTYSLVYEHKTFGLTLWEFCGEGTWYADFEGRTSKFYSADDVSNMETQATDSGQQLPLDFYYGGCFWGAFGSDNPWGIVSSKPTGPEDCASSAQSAGLSHINLQPDKNEGQVKPGTLICTVTDAGVALIQVKSLRGSNSMDTPEHVDLDVTLWKKG
ncbi:hypothetical protein ACFV7R_35035 [Streptomyces sp. NPDC059866]|uniref:hypothetical protein n=1 Tax=Streptomyces sp. NPDC059866 TaxID=3346978 RepID=UPI0036476EF5